MSLNRQFKFAKVVARVNLAISLALAATAMSGCGQSETADHPEDADFIEGVVRSPAGSEGGVWVIAESADKPDVALRKIVVTDDEGRFVLPELPAGKYKVWVRGYGLLDSAKADGEPGEALNFTVQPAPDEQTAAQIYPANYWMSLLEPPPADAFPEPGVKRLPEMEHSGAGLSDVAGTQAEFFHQITVCSGCHQLGNKATRELNPAMGDFSTEKAAWDHRVRAGPHGMIMTIIFSMLPRQVGIEMFAKWTARIEAGAAPPAPPRPKGIERNVVITQWGWGAGPDDWIHDVISTDKRNPRVNANGKVYGAGQGTGSLLVLDPRTNSASSLKVPALIPEQQLTDAMLVGMDKDHAKVESPMWGSSEVWTGKTIPHNPMFDEKGRVWLTSRVRRMHDNPNFCHDGSTPYSKAAPLHESERQVTMYDPKSNGWETIDTCFSTHHLQFARDADNTLYFSGDQGLVGWLNTRVYDQTGDSQAAQGWCPVYSNVDDQGKGREGIRKRPRSRSYGIGVSPLDGSVWYAAPGLPGQLVRFERGNEPPLSCRSEVWEPPFGNDVTGAALGYAPKGLDVDTNGVAWLTLHSGALASFDRRKCQSVNPTGQGCREGWTLYPPPGPAIGNTERSADRLYFNWSDNFDVLGLGRNTQFATGSNSDSLLVLPPESEDFLVFRVPYPLGFLARGMDGRIDDPEAGWKGRGIWTNQASLALWHSETGEDSKPFVMRFQLRPDPLAK